MRAIGNWCDVCGSPWCTAAPTVALSVNAAAIRMCWCQHHGDSGGTQQARVCRIPAIGPNREKLRRPGVAQREGTT